MSTVMTPNEAQPAAPHHRRSREEVEALAKNFIGAAVEPGAGAPAKPRIPLLAAAAGGVIVLIVVAFVAMPGKPAAEAPRATPEQSRAALEAEAMRQRFEAERERKRKELAASNAYMEKMAAADAQLMKDMSAQAEMLASRVAAKPASTPAPTPADSEPTPREATAKAAPAPTTTAASAPAKPAPTKTATTTTTTAATQEPAKAQPAAAAPVQVAQAAKSDCSIHVSELSKSGKLTYADVAKMKGARLDADSGNVFTPPVQAGGRSVVFEVMPTGCVRVVRR